MLIKTTDIISNTMGIYKINYPNGKIYIGQSIDIKRRIGEHNWNSHKKLQPCDAAIKKYGYIEEIEILEIVSDASLLNEKEQYWINFYHSNNKEIGYNLTSGGDSSYRIGEENLRAIFTNDEVLDIRYRKFKQERKIQVYQDYSDRSFASFENVWLGRGYPNIGQQYLKQCPKKTRNEYSSEANAGIRNNKAKFTEDEVREIRRLYEEDHKTFVEIAKIYNNRVAANTISRIARRISYSCIK